MAIRTLKRISSYTGLAREANRLRRAETEQVRTQVRSHLITRMGKMRGLPQKLGQMLSMSASDDDDDTGAAAQFATLQEQAEPLPLDAVLPVMESTWGCSIQSVLREIDPVAHAASLGQVHRATMLDGTEVAVKVQYPGIRDAVMTDLKLLGWLSLPVGNLRSGFDLADYRQTILEDLERELDYRQEAEQQRAFSRWADNDPFLIVPKVIDRWSGEKVLVSQWEDGEHWDVVRKTWDPSQRQELSKCLLRFFLTGLFSQQRMQADWHPGNFRFRRNGDRVQVLLYDFGCIYQPTDDQRFALARLIQATMERGESPWPLFLKLGFNREFLEPLADKLPALCRVLFDPFCAEYPYDLNNWNLDERVGDILGDDRWNFRVAGPAGLIFLLRVFHGLKFYLEGLQAPIAWQKTLKPCIKVLGSQMYQMQLETTSTPHRDYTSLAQYLKIRVRRDGQTKVNLTQRASAIDNLDELIDEKVKTLIEQQGIDLNEIVSNIRRRGYTPGPVFDLTDGNKETKVWLE